MSYAKLLDCTLRDGAYIIDKTFGNSVIKGIINGLVQANIDIIEIGFLQNEGKGEGKTVFYDSKDAEKFIPIHKGKNLFTVLADYSRYSIENLDEYTGRSFDAVRACFFKNERKDALDFFRGIKSRGYKLFIQPVDVLGYSDVEMIEFIQMINEIEPYCFSIVDTFGSMYEDDLQRVFSIIDHNLIPECRIGFHSHNNLQMSSALSQRFLNISYGRRKVIVDGTISGMGRGAGNTPTELIAQYMVSKLGYHYDMDAILDVIDNYVGRIRSKASWGYDTNMFLAGNYGAHVNNIAYLKQKNSIRSKDIRFILNKIGEQARKRYHYDLLEKVYYDYMNAEIDDTESINLLRSELKGKNVILVAPGKSTLDEHENIVRYIKKNQSIVISVNFLDKYIKSDYIYMSNVKRYSEYMQQEEIYPVIKIFTSNVKKERENSDERIVFVHRLLKCGWEYMDNSSILLLRLLNLLDVSRIGIAGLDGYEYTLSGNYANDKLEVYVPKGSALRINKEIYSMLEDFMQTKKEKIIVEFVTKTRFSEVLNEKRY